MKRFITSAVAAALVPAFGTLAQASAHGHSQGGSSHAIYGSGHHESHHEYHQESHHEYHQESHYEHHGVHAYYHKDHHPWSSCYWNSSYGCNVYFDVDCGCYYYFCVPDDCYYPVTYCPYNRYTW